MSRSEMQEELLDAAEHLHTLHSFYGGDVPEPQRSNEALESAKMTFNRLVGDIRFVEMAELLALVRAHDRKLKRPEDALERGDVVEGSGGRFGRITSWGFDEEGSFGYFVHTDHSGRWEWVYHHVETLKRAYRQLEPAREDGA